MSEPDPLDRACAQIGRFLYYFSKLENQLDAALIRIFEINSSAAGIIKGSIDFAKRFNLVRTATLQEIADEGERRRVDKILKEVMTFNTNRQVVVHSMFEPE